jgi:hypothetical protein
MLLVRSTHDRPLGYSCFFLILAGRLPAVAAEGPTTDVLNIAQTA